MAYLALCWRIAGYAPIVTRVSMLLIAAFSLLGVFRLAQRLANSEVAIASTLCTALYPVFFAQSSLAQVDLAAAGLTFWALLAYAEDRRVLTVIYSTGSIGERNRNPGARRPTVMGMYHWRVAGHPKSVEP